MRGRGFELPNVAMRGGGHPGRIRIAGMSFVKQTGDVSIEASFKKHPAKVYESSLM